MEHTMELLYREEVYAVIGAAIEVHRELGSGFLEAVYQECLEYELEDRTIPFEPQKHLTITYKGRTLKKKYIADLITHATIIVELKAEDCLTSKDESQLLHYLKITGFRVGVLINFGSYGKLEWKRMIV
ncbi:MAG: GxxExxY protein [Ignavibacteriae bacterium]|nr:GxxExxY protein [Ignavibacteriota bacterium]